MVKLTERVKRLNISVKNKIFTLFLGKYKSLFKGRGIDFEDLREYIPGDSIKDIDWNSLAKTNQLFIKKYQETRELNIYFCLDTSSSMNWGISENMLKSDVALDFITLLSYAATQNSDKFGCIYFSTQIDKIIPLSKGRAQMLRIINTSENILDQSYFKKSDIKVLLKYLISKIKKRVICFIITDNTDFDDETLKLLKAANLRHEMTFINIHELLNYYSDLNRLIEVQDIETGQKYSLDLSDKKLRGKYIEFIKNNLDSFKNKLKRNKIETLFLQPSSNITFEVLKFFNNQSNKKISYE